MEVAVKLSPAARHPTTCRRNSQYARRSSAMSMPTYRDAVDMARGCTENKRCTADTDQRVDGSPPGDIRESGLNIADYGSDECDDPTELRHISIHPYQAHCMQGEVPKRRRQ